MKMKLLVAAIGLFAASAAFSQSAIIRGQSAAGVYENLVSDGSGHLQVNINSSSAAAGVTATNQTLTVTNASQALVAANASRKFFFIQNNDAAGIIYVTFGATSTTALGVKLTSGQSWQITSNAPVGSVNIIGSIASNANVIYVDGQ